jgi:hypothetical protein
MLENSKYINMDVAENKREKVVRLMVSSQITLGFNATWSSLSLCKNEWIVKIFEQ